MASTMTTERPVSALDTIYMRRSVRSFSRDRVEDSTVRGLLDAAVQAPTAMHQQPWVFAVIQDRQLLSKLSERVKERWLREAEPPAGVHAGAAELHPGFVARLHDPAFDVFYGATTLVVIGARRIDDFVTADCWLAAENLMLAASALGLDTCCIGMAVPALNMPETRAELGIPADVTAIAAIIVGVPAGASAPVARRDPEIVSWR